VHALLAAGLRRGLSEEVAKRITRLIRDEHPKVKSQIQGDAVRVSGKSRDDLQKVIARLRGIEDLPVPHGALISFDRRKCKAPLNGPRATGNHCPEGFASHKYPGPGFEGFENTSAEASYYTWVDHHNTVGLGENVPISTANLQDGFAALKDGQMILMRVPYPMGFFAKGLDGRIDDPSAGWKGRGLWSASGDRTPWLNELGKGARPLAVHVQVRPDPLAH
jgi:hypothetical protein